MDYLEGGKMKINKIFEAFAKSKTGQKLYKWACEPKSEYFLNNTLPQVETVLSTACYVWSTAKQKNIEPEQKQLLQIQNVGSGVVGVAIGSAANRWISKKTDEIVKDLDPKKLDPKALRKVSTGLRIAAPLLTTAILMRLVLPTLTAGLSGKMMDKKREKEAAKKLSIKA